MKNKTIKFYRDRVYGVIKNYVKDPEVANAITMLTSRKTLTEQDMKALELLGFTFEEVLNK
jgi:hypothetical protein